MNVIFLALFPRIHRDFREEGDERELAIPFRIFKKERGWKDGIAT